MNRRDIIFLGILFLAIIIIGMLYVGYFSNIIEGFAKSYIDKINETITDTSGNTLRTYILDPSNTTMTSIEKREIMNFILEIDSNISPIYINCQSNNCTNIPKSNLQIIQNIIDPTYGTLTNYINNSTIIDKERLIYPLSIAYMSILDAQKDCSGNFCN